MPSSPSFIHSLLRLPILVVAAFSINAIDNSYLGGVIDITVVFVLSIVVDGGGGTPPS
jgi:hypothetical protein